MGELYIITPRTMPVTVMVNEYFFAHYQWDLSVNTSILLKKCCNLPKCFSRINHKLTCTTINNRPHLLNNKQLLLQLLNNKQLLPQ